MIQCTPRDHLPARSLGPVKIGPGRPALSPFPLPSFNPFNPFNLFNPFNPFSPFNLFSLFNLFNPFNLFSLFNLFNLFNHQLYPLPFQL